MEKLVTIIDGDKITIQEAEYIEHGWYVVVHDELIQLYEIPYGGGEPIFIDKFTTLISAINKGKSLT